MRHAGDPGYVVVSADCHGGANLWEYRDYLDPTYRDRFDQWAASYEIPYDDMKDEETGGRNWQSARRLAELEDDGVVAEVIYPNTVPPFFATSPLGAVTMPTSKEELELRWAGLRAHNRWLAEFCSAAAGRRAGVIQIALQNIDATVSEIRWARAAGLTGGVLLPGAPPGSGLPALHDQDYYEPLWTACEETGMPVNCHSGSAAPRLGDTPAAHVLFMLEMCWWDQRILRQMILGGILERHPDLQVVFTEAGVAWVPQELTTLEYLFDSMSEPGARELSSGAQVVGALSCRPHEYWKRQCHVGASFMHPTDLAHIPQLDAHTIMWGSDYPHHESSFPYSRSAIASTFAGVTEPVTERILGTNAAELYGFDMHRLTALSRGLGPRRAAVHAGIDRRDIPPPAAKCPAFAGLLGASHQLRWGDNRAPSHPVAASSLPRSIAPADSVHSPNG